MSEVEIRTLNDLKELVFHVPAYQRGFRWGKTQVDALLQDIEVAQAQSLTRSYFLQPVVVKDMGERRYELVDGQQRLTTLWLIQHHLSSRIGMPAWRAKYTLEYQTRKESAGFLDDLGSVPQRPPGSIDEDHLLTAYDAIERWFARSSPENDGGKVFFQWHGFLTSNVKLIWFMDNDSPGETLFMNLNRGRIPLSNSELIKALLVAHAPVGKETDTEARQIEITAQWDDMERDLHNPGFWAFLSGTAAGGEDKPRLEYLFDLIVPDDDQLHEDDYRTFAAYAARVRDRRQDPNLGTYVLEVVWRKEIRASYLRLQDWFEDRELYHKIGFLIAVNHPQGRKDLLRGFLKLETTKSEFKKRIDHRIREELSAVSGDRNIGKLKYDNPRHYELLRKVLLLYNVLSCMNAGIGGKDRSSSTERYEFERHYADAWTLEHVNPQSDGFLAGNATREDKGQWMGWLRKHKPYLSLPQKDVSDEAAQAWTATTEAVARAIQNGENMLTAKEFAIMREAIVARFGKDFSDLMGSIQNLALLSHNANASIGNDLFVEKRRAILAKAARGEFIPLCTRRLFLKYYGKKTSDPCESSEPDVMQYSLAFWTRSDAHYYLEDMTEVLASFLPR